MLGLGLKAPCGLFLQCLDLLHALALALRVHCLDNVKCYKISLFLQFVYLGVHCIADVPMFFRL